MEMLRIRLRVQVLNSSLTDQDPWDSKESDLATLSGRASTGSQFASLSSKDSSRPNVVSVKSGLRSEDP